MKSSNTKPPAIQSVQIIFKTHLDLGFTDLARNVEKKYFTRFIPQAMELARSLRERGGSERFIWTVGSYLIFEYLERATPAGRRAMEKAIAAGDIAWHAAPFTTHTELMDPPMFRYGLSLSQRLDTRFGKKTISAKMTDVTGHCRAIIPMLADVGVEMFHIGANPASSPPDVPPMFRWKHPGGSHLTVMYQKDYGGVAQIPGTPTAVLLAFTGDNHGPQSPDAVVQIFDDIRARFPGARAVAATLDDTARAIRPIAGKLPVITEELADGWIHGATTDPQKIAHYRELQRLRTRWLAEKKFKPADKTDTAFTRHLIMVAEHTWGMDEKTHLDDYENYRAEQLAAHRKDANFVKFESSWKEQREYLKKAVKALPSKLRAEAEAHLKSLRPHRPKTAGFSPRSSLETKRWQITFDESTGAIVGLTDKASDRKWASPRNPLALFAYQTFAEADFDRYLRQYATQKIWWIIKDITKPGVGKQGAKAMYLHPESAEILHRADDEGDRFIVNLTMPKSTPAGCPPVLVNEVFLPHTGKRVDLVFQWFDKPATRMGESCWLSFTPIVAQPNNWLMDKMGDWISPLDVISKGNRKLHAIRNGILYKDKTCSLRIDSLDTPVVAPGWPSLLDFNNRQPVLSKGMHFNLFNNVWGTNFPMWSEGDARFRLSMQFT